MIGMLKALGSNKYQIAQRPPVLYSILGRFLQEKQTKQLIRNARVWFDKGTSTKMGEITIFNGFFSRLLFLPEKRVRYKLDSSGHWFCLNPDFPSIHYKADRKALSILNKL